MKSPGPWFGNWFNAKPVGRAGVAGVLVCKTHDMALDSTPIDPTPPTCRACQHLDMGRYCKVIYKRVGFKLRYAVIQDLDRPWRCPDFQSNL